MQTKNDESSGSHASNQENAAAEDNDHDSWALPILKYAEERKKATSKICINCGERKPQSEFHAMQGRCKPCFRIYQREYNHKHGVRPYKDAKDCTLYLGVHVAERVLSNVFENVQLMPFGNKGFDFICGKGYKIDVKSACIVDGVRWTGWSFAINKNKIADYFLCLGFDDRTHLAPQFLLLIPAEKFNDKITLRVSKLNIEKWSEYLLPLEKVESCCDSLKGVV